jgi:hypothetical protein
MPWRRMYQTNSDDVWGQVKYKKGNAPYLINQSPGICVGMTALWLKKMFTHGSSYSEPDQAASITLRAKWNILYNSMAKGEIEDVQNLVRQEAHLGLLQNAGLMREFVQWLTPAAAVTYMRHHPGSYFIFIGFHALAVVTENSGRNMGYYFSIPPMALGRRGSLATSTTCRPWYVTSMVQYLHTTRSGRFAGYITAHDSSRAQGPPSLKAADEFAVLYPDPDRRCWDRHADSLQELAADLWQQCVGENRIYHAPTTFGLGTA